MNNLLLAPVLVPLVAAALALLCRGHLNAQRAVFLIASLVEFALSVLLLTLTSLRGGLRFQAGGWPAPYAIELRIDRLSALLLMTLSLVVLALVMQVLTERHDSLDRRGRIPIFLMLTAGIAGTLLAYDLFNLFVWFELTMICAFVLLALGGEPKQLRGAVKYVVLNLVGGTLFLVALGLVYGSFGTLAMREITARSHGSLAPATEPLILGLLVISFLIKAAGFPFSSWLPASYHTAHPTTHALLAASLTKLGVCALVRVTVTLFPPDPWIQSVLLGVGSLSILFGGLGALVETNARRLVSFVLIGQIGVLILALAVPSELSLGAVTFLMVGEILGLAALILWLGELETIFESPILKKMGGLARSHPGAAAGLGFVLISLAGLPPLAGFVGKVGLLEAGIGPLPQVLVLVSSGLTFLAFLRLWLQVCWGGGREIESSRTPNAITFLLMCLLALALVAGPVYDQARVAGSDVLREGATK